MRVYRDISFVRFSNRNKNLRNVMPEAAINTLGVINRDSQSHAGEATKEKLVTVEQLVRAYPRRAK